MNIEVAEYVSIGEEGYSTQLVEDFSGLDHTWYCCNTDKNMKNGQYDKECCDLGEAQKVALVFSKIQRTSFMLVISRIVASRQIKLDFYLFADDWVGLTSVALLEYGISYMIKLEDEVVGLDYLMNWFSIGFSKGCYSSWLVMFGPVLLISGCPFLAW